MRSGATKKITPRSTLFPGMSRGIVIARYGRVQRKKGPGEEQFPRAVVFVCRGLTLEGKFNPEPQHHGDGEKEQIPGHEEGTVHDGQDDGEDHEDENENGPDAHNGSLLMDNTALPSIYQSPLRSCLW